MRLAGGFFLIALLALSAPVLAFAHIGDDLSQLRQAYGATAAKAGNALVYQRNGYSIAVFFDGDHSAMEIFTRDGSMKDKTDISQDDINQILALEGDGQDWNQVTSHSGKLTWLRADKKLIARLSDDTDKPDAKVFVVMVNQK